LVKGLRSKDPIHISQWEPDADGDEQGSGDGSRPPVDFAHDGERFAEELGVEGDDACENQYRDSRADAEQWREEYVGLELRR